MNTGEKEDCHMTKKNPTIGIIAEDTSDIDTIRELIIRISKNNKIAIKGRSKNGCGILLRKCHDWARNLADIRCSVLIVIHDSDNNNPTEIYKKVKEKLDPSPITNHLITVPVQELEAWLLADPEGIKKSLNLKETPNIKYSTELVNSPKEFLEAAIYKASRKEMYYQNTKHNMIIAKTISIDLIRKKCPSFRDFHDFILSNTK